MNNPNSQRIVPLEPTETMVKAGRAKFNRKVPAHIRVAEIYRAMVTAAPQSGPAGDVPDSEIKNAAPQVPVAGKSGSAGLSEDSPAAAAPEAGAEREEWAVYCPSCKEQWVVNYRHPGAELCERCEARAMFPDERSATHSGPG